MLNSEPSTRAQVVTRRTYNRPKNDEGTAFESWIETVIRVGRHQQWLWERAQGSELSPEQYKELSHFINLMMERKISVSGRTLWLGGTAVAKSREASQFNCSFAQAATVHDVVDAFWLLLQGCGYGFSGIPGVLNGFARKHQVEFIRSKMTIDDWNNGIRGAERNHETVDGKVWHITIGDSAEAWAKAVGKILAGKHNAPKLVIDLSQIRAGGIRLRGYGWISSGDGPFAEALEAICDLMNKRRGKLLTRINILDVMNLLGTTLSSRRSAEIALCPYGDPEWREFATAKKDHWANGNKHRGQSNNSLVFYQKPSRDDLADIFKLMKDAGGSEPGFINAQESLRRAPWFKGVNPCLTGDTLIPVFRDGLRRISDLDGRTVAVRDGNGHVVPALVKKTGENAELVEVALSDGSIYRTTPNHEFVLKDGTKMAANDLTPGADLKPSDIADMFGQKHDPKRAYLDAWMIADGTWNGSNKQWSKLYLYEPKHKYADELSAVGLSFSGSDCQNRLVATLKEAPIDKSLVPEYVLRGDRDTVAAFIRGYTQSDGHVGHTTKGWLVQYSSIHRCFLQNLQALLRLFGVKSMISMMQDSGDRMLPDGNGGHKLYQCQTSWRLTVSNPAQFFAHFDPSKNKRGPYNKPTVIKVVSVRPLEEREDVYCLGVITTASFDLPTVHSGNCAEILLGDKSFCNLVEVDLGKFNGDEEGLRDAIRLAARANYRQTCVNLDDGVLQRSWHELNQFLRLCGVGLTGIVRWEHVKDGEAFRALRQAAQVGANSMADELGLPRSKAVTTVKPSGTLSKLMDTTEGVHRPLGKFLFNNINFSSHDPLVELLRDAGYRVFENPYDTNNTLVTFPVAYEDVEFDVIDGKEVNVESAVSQLERYKLLMKNYVDHNCSITVSYSPEEVPAIIDWILENWETYVGVSFLYRNDPTKTAADLGYPYLPQEVVTKEVYDEYVATLKPIDIDAANSLLELDENGCSVGGCPIK